MNIGGCDERGSIDATIVSEEAAITGQSSDRFKIFVKTTSSTNRSLIAVAGLTRTEQDLLNAARFDDRQWKQMFRVTVRGEERTIPMPAMLGDYRIEDKFIVFEPRFPFRHSLTYRAEFDPAKLPQSASDATELALEFSLPAPPVLAPTTVTAVYPSRGELPENQLKFYIHFSAPMSQGEAYNRIHLLDTYNEEVQFPFLELEEELWNNSGTRLTLFFDPGRIKRGLRPHEEIGAALQQGESYTLVIDGDWLDAAGNRLKESFHKSFDVAAPDYTQPTTNRWKIHAPGAGTTKPLLIQFDEPLDHAMLRRLNVMNATRNPISGTIEIDAEETGWRFRPDHLWENGSFFLEIPATLEDLAGNSIARPFEVDMLRPRQRTITTESVEVPFEVRAAR